MINSIRLLTIASALLQATVAVAFSDETATLTRGKNASESDNEKTSVLTLGEGESAKAVWAGRTHPWTPVAGDPFNVILLVTRAGETWLASPFLSFAAPSSSSVYEKSSFEIAGPAIIRLQASSDDGTRSVTFKVTRVGTASPPAEVPQEAGSNFDVILEQSSDLVNWTPANPGTYSGTETKRFFRTRIVKKP
jgi:hypothetical protein